MPYNGNGRTGRYGGRRFNGGNESDIDDFGPRNKRPSGRRRPGQNKRSANGARKAQADQLRRMADQIDPPREEYDRNNDARGDYDAGSRHRLRIGYRL